LQLTPGISSESNVLGSLWSYVADSAAQLNSMLAGRKDRRRGLPFAGRVLISQSVSIRLSAGPSSDQLMSFVSEGIMKRGQLYE
jgi:hypothetical protein